MSYVRPQIAAMNGYVPGEQPPAGKFIKLNTNENPYPASPNVRRSIESVLDGGLSRYPNAMSQPFRIRAAEVLGVPPDWILCGNGSDDILTIVTRTFVSETDPLRFPYPSYVLYKTLAEIQGARYEEIFFQEDWTLGPDFVSDSGNVKLAFLANPNSPSGTVLTPQQVLRIAEQLPCPLLVDEAYADFAETHCLELVSQNERIMVSRTLSKAYALAGLRFGFLVAQPSLLEQLTKVKDSYNCDALSIAGAVAAIDDQAWLAEHRARILATRQRLSERLAEMGFQVTPSQANFVWATYPERPVQPIYEELKANRILVRYMNYPGWGDGLRISVGTEDQNEAFLDLLQSLLRDS